jgi:hypothetical protein
MTGHPIPGGEERDNDLEKIPWLQKPPRLKHRSQIIAQTLR